MCTSYEQTPVMKFSCSPCVVESRLSWIEDAAGRLRFPNLKFGELQRVGYLCRRMVRAEGRSLFVSLRHGFWTPGRKTDTANNKNNRHMKKILFAAAAALVALTACNGARKTVALEGTQWKLEQMEGIPAEAITREADFFTLTFNAADTMVNGRTNCNRFFGRYALNGNELEFDNMGMTRMACPEMEYENAFVEMLNGVDGYAIEGETLTLLGNGKALATFKAQSAAVPTTQDAPAARVTPVEAAEAAIEVMDSIDVVE